MQKEYYYIDGKEQKGPYSIEQLKTVGLKRDTLVWTEDFENWKAVWEVEELKILLKKTPPPPPIFDDSSKLTIEIKNEKEEDTKVLVEDSNVKFLVTFKIYTFSVFIIGAAILGAFLFSNSKKNELKAEIYNRIENIFDGKSVVLDGTFSLTQGELEDTGFNEKKSKLKKTWSLNYIDSFFLDDTFSQQWWERDKLYTIFKSTYGGFTIKMITKRYPDGYDLETIESGDMGYKKPASKYVQPEYWNGYKLSDGYYSNNYRLPIRECYSQAYEFFTKDDRKSPGAYSPGKYVDITNFPDISNKYYYMSNREPIQYTSSGHTSSYWYSSDNHEANINNEDWAVYYSLTGNHYVISENSKTINKDLITYLAISIGTIVLVLIFIYFSKPKYFRNLNLYGKRWKNTSNNDQIIYFEHSFFGEQLFTELINKSVIKGVLKFTDKGNTINLSYPQNELFYKLDKIDRDNLSLISLNDKREITFIRIGSEEKSTITNNEVTENKETN